MEGKTLLRAYRLATRRDSTGGDYAAAISQLLELADIPAGTSSRSSSPPSSPKLPRALQGTALLPHRQRAAGAGAERPL